MSTRHYVPPVFVAYLVIGGLLSWRRPARLLAVLAPYGLALGTASIETGRRLDSTSDRVRVPLAFGAMHIGWGLGFWSGLMHRTGAGETAGADSGTGAGEDLTA
jgi:hypothetical protein